MTTVGGGSSDSGTRAACDVGSGPEVGSSADSGVESIELLEDWDDDAEEGTSDSVKVRCMLVQVKKFCFRFCSR